MIYTETDKKMMSAALERAQQAGAKGEIPIGCVIAKGETVISSAGNETEETGDLTAHAEILAIRRAERYNLKGATLYVTLEPCPMCAGAIAMSGIKRVIYGAPDKKYGCCGSVYRITEDPVFPNYCPADGGLLEDECASALKQGFDGIRSAKP